MWIERLTIDHDRHDDDDDDSNDDVIALSHFDCSRVNYRHQPSHKLLHFCTLTSVMACHSC